MPTNSNRLTIGILVSWLADPYVQPVVTAISNVLRQRGAGVLCFFPGEPPTPREDDIVHDLIHESSVDGLIILSGSLFPSSELVTLCCKRHEDLPLVSVGAAPEGVPATTSNPDAGIRQAVHHLAQVHERSRIAFICGPQGQEEASKRFAAYRTALEEQGLPFDANLVTPGAYVEASGESAVEVLIDQRRAAPDAILAANDAMALGAMSALRRRGIRVPEDVSVIGFDDAVNATCSIPPLTSVAQPVRDLGQKAAQMILAQIEGELESEHVEFETSLVVRKSCGAGCEEPLTGDAKPVQALDVGVDEWLSKRKEQLLKLLTRTLTPATAPSRAKLLELLTALATDVQSDRGVFANALQESLERSWESGQEIWRWRDAVSALRAQLVPSLYYDHNLQLRISDLLDQARLIVGDTLQRARNKEDLQQRERTFVFNGLTEGLIRARSFRELLEALRQGLPRLGFRTYHLALLEEDGEWANLIVTSENGKQNEGLRYRTRQVVPQGMLPADRPYFITVQPLCFQREPLGMLLLEAGVSDGILISCLANQLKSALYRLRAFREDTKAGVKAAFKSHTRTGETHTRSNPRFVGRYQLLRPIGTGGMATVFLAQTEVVNGVHRRVALKLMLPELVAQGSGWAEQLIEEAGLAASIQHPNVVQVLDVGEDPAGVFMVMEYVDGGSLARLLKSLREKGEKIPLPIAGRILVDTLAGLHAAHELSSPDGVPLQLVHRDVSIQNILLGSDGVARLADFGIAKTTSSSDLTATGALKGKVRYMSPEQALNKQLDRRSDVWAAGVVAWELISGRRLHADQPDTAILLKIVQEPPQRLRGLVKDLPIAIEQAVAGALTLDSKNRFATAEAFRVATFEAFRDSVGLADRDTVARFVQATMGDTQTREQSDQAS